MRDTYPEQKGKVEVIVDDDQGNYHIEYKDQSYFIDKLNLFSVRDNIPKIHDDDILIGWNSFPFGFGYLDKYYSNTEDNPVFIYMSRLPDVYLRRDYDYTIDTFVFEGTDLQFVFSDMFVLSTAYAYNFLIHYPNEQYITLYSSMHPRLQISLRLFRANGVWFAGGNSNLALFEVSDECLALLNINT